MTEKINETIQKFGHPDTVVAAYEHWIVLLRPGQVTLGSLILAARSDATAFSDLESAAFAELARVTRDIESALKQAVSYEKINYLMLMMVDPHVHFHVFPRYSGVRQAEGIAVADVGWPKTPDLTNAQILDADQTRTLVRWLKGYWPK